jgi:hypothetical protein
MALVKKIEDCASTAVLNKLDVREGSQGNIHPPSILLPPFLSKVFLLPPSLRTLPEPSRTSTLKRDVFTAHRAARWVLRGEHSPREAACGNQPGPYFDAGAGAVIPGAGVDVLGAGADVAGAGAGFEVAWEGLVVAGAGAIELCTDAG